MALERFPKSKYLHQLATMQDEMEDWKVRYAMLGDQDPYGWLGGRYDARAAVLDEAVQQIMRLRDHLYDLPRLS